MAINTDSEILSLKETSKLLHVSTQTLRQWDKKGILKALRYGNRGDRRYHKSDVLSLAGYRDGTDPSVKGKSASPAQSLADRLNRLYLVTSSLTHSISMDKAAQIILQQAVAALHADRGVIMTMSQDGTDLTLSHHIGYKKKELETRMTIPLTAFIPLTEAATSRETILIESNEEMKLRYPHISTVSHALLGESFAAIPIVLEGYVYGVLGISCNTPCVYTKEDSIFLNTITKQLALAYDRFNLAKERDLRSSHSQHLDHVIRNVYEAGIKLLIPQTLEKTYQTVVAEAISLVGGTHGSIFIPQDGEMVRVHTSDPALYNIKVRSTGYTYRTFKKRIPYLHHREKMVQNHREFVKMKLHSDLSIPLAYGDTSIGVLSIMSSGKQVLTERDLNTLTYFGPLAALAIVKAQNYDESVKALETRDLFISMAAHEFKNPMTSMNAYTQLLMRKDFEDASVRKLIDGLNLSSHRLTVLMNELLYVSQIRRGTLKFELKPLKIKPFIMRIVNDFMIVHPDRTLEYKLENVSAESTFMGDNDKLIQAIINVLNNAAKFSPPERPITLKVKKTSHEITISIKDRGIGIAKKDMPNIFNRFFKGEHEKEGMGLGLHLVKHIIDNHHGRIDITSRKNNGTTVIIILPL